MKVILTTNRSVKHDAKRAREKRKDVIADAEPTTIY
jgi:hypothetical protein